MDLEKVIELFLEEKINAKEVNNMFEKGELTLESIKDKFEFGQIIKKLNQKYKEVMKEPVMLPYDCTWKDTIISLMIAIENKKKVEDVVDSMYSYNDTDLY